MSGTIIIFDAHSHTYPLSTVIRGANKPEQTSKLQNFNAFNMIYFQTLFNIAIKVLLGNCICSNWNKWALRWWSIKFPTNFVVLRSRQQWLEHSFFTPYRTKIHTNSMYAQRRKTMRLGYVKNLCSSEPQFTSDSEVTVLSCLSNSFCKQGKRY